jgi:hypothetical protein
VLLLLLLLQVLSYHIILGMLLSSQLTERQALRTALAGAAPLVVKVSSRCQGPAGRLSPCRIRLRVLHLFCVPQASF